MNLQYFRRAGQWNHQGPERGGIARRVRRRWGWATMIVAMAIVGAGCATDYVTGKRTFSLVSESQEIQMGREADPAIVAQYGLYDDPELAAYVAQLGQRLARVSQRPQLQYTFRLIDTPVVNAFALPGGYIYITRGILAHFNSEDELAGVLGHEIGHVVARHGAEQMSRVTLASLGLGLGVALSEDFAQFAEVAGAGVGLLFLKFSRGQESESDALGVEYSTRLGYDARRMAAFFQTLDRLSGESGQSLPGFLSTHPDPGGREVRVHEMAEEWQGRVAYRPLDTDREAYLKRLDGVVYGDDPRQGYREGDMFYHPQMAFQFPVPSGWKLANTPTVVQMASADEKAMVQLSLGEASTPAAEADAFVTKNKVVVRTRQASRIGGFNAVVMESTLDTEKGQLRIQSYFIRKDQATYVFHGFTTAALWDAHRAAFVRVGEGFRRVTDADVLSKEPRRLRVEPAPSGGNLAGVLAEMGVPVDMTRELAIVNGRLLEDRVTRGELIKVVR